MDANSIHTLTAWLRVCWGSLLGLFTLLPTHSLPHSQPAYRRQCPGQPGPADCDGEARHTLTHGILWKRVL